MMRMIGEHARAAAATIRLAPTDQKNTALLAAAENIRASAPAILAANTEDVETAQDDHLSKAMIDRLRLDDARLQSIVDGLRAVAALPDPVGKKIAEWTRPNGLSFERVRTPIGVIAIIYESRPNVTIDAAALCLKAGNAAILRGGSEALRTSTSLFRCFADALKASGLPETTIQLVPTSDRAAVGAILSGLDG
ncbi:MAG: aldehyde dehydrogenase family protein, partial [Parvularculaceae bacterium]